MTRYDTIVIGLGGMGGAAAYRLAQRGQRVLGLDTFGPVHDRGSSHGGSRITRRAYFEAPEYVPLLMRTHELWDELERESGRHLFTRCGGLMLGKPESRAVAGSLLSARQWDLPHELLDSGEIRHRFPTLRPDDDEVALYEAGAGVVSPEETVGAHLDLAARAGAELHHHERVLSWTADSGGVRVHTRQGDYTARDLVVCPGAWAPELLADLGVGFTVEREVQYWFAPVDVEPFRPDRQPIYVWERDRQFYGFPALDGESVKIGFHHSGDLCTADTVDRTVRPEEIAAVAEFAGRVSPSLPGRFVRAATCLYTNTADENFVIARHPAHERVVVACGFSGHGFKFVPVVGEILADLVTEGGTAHPIALFDPARLTGAR